MKMKAGGLGNLLFCGKRRQENIQYFLKDHKKIQAWSMNACLNTDQWSFDVSSWSIVNTPMFS